MIRQGPWNRWGDPTPRRWNFGVHRHLLWSKNRKKAGQEGTGSPTSTLLSGVSTYHSRRRHRSQVGIGHCGRDVGALRLSGSGWVPRWTPVETPKRGVDKEITQNCLSPLSAGEESRGRRSPRLILRHGEGRPEDPCHLNGRMVPSKAVLCPY